MEALYAIITGGKVQGVIVADADFIAANYPGAPRVDQLTPHPGPGWSYAGGSFTPPPAPPAPPASTDFSPWGFRKLLTFAERVAIDNYPADAPAGGEVRTIREDFRAAQDIDTADPDTQQALNFLATAAPDGPGLLTPARAAAILAGQPPA